MKKLYLTTILVISAIVSSYAQITTDPNGNVGVGTLTPQSKLEVNNGSYNTGNQIIVSGGEPTRYFGLIETKTVAGQATFSLGTKSNYANYFETLNLRNGNVGIGTNTTDAKFTVYQSNQLGSIVQNNTLLSTISGIAGVGNRFQNNLWLVRNAAGNDWYTTRLHDGISIDGSFTQPQINTATWWERDPANDIQSWGGGNTAYLTINHGKVGIGTVDTHGYQLAVNGDVHAKQVVIDLVNWPDYVFKPSYYLKPLSEVKTYIDLNHRLPEMPSEKEVAEKGVDLGEMNKVLVKKVEELTLYMIELQKQIDQLKEK